MLDIALPSDSILALISEGVNLWIMLMFNRLDIYGSDVATIYIMRYGFFIFNIGIKKLKPVIDMAVKTIALVGNFFSNLGVIKIEKPVKNLPKVTMIDTAAVSMPVMWKKCWENIINDKAVPSKIDKVIKSTITLFPSLLLKKETTLSLIFKAFDSSLEHSNKHH